jgi:hypothetical protein
MKFIKTLVVAGAAAALGKAAQKYYADPANREKINGKLEEAKRGIASMGATPPKHG